MTTVNSEAERPQFDEAIVRRRILEMAHNGSTAHIACAFSLVEILCELYENFVRYPNNDPDADGRDFLVLSKGHGVMAQYACMFENGWITQAQLDTYFADGSTLHGLSDSHTPGLEVTSGQTVQLLPQASATEIILGWKSGLQTNSPENFRVDPVFASLQCTELHKGTAQSVVVLGVSVDYLKTSSCRRVLDLQHPRVLSQDGPGLVELELLC